MKIRIALAAVGLGMAEVGLGMIYRPLVLISLGALLLLTAARGGVKK